MGSRASGAALIAVGRRRRPGAVTCGSQSCLRLKRSTRYTIRSSPAGLDDAREIVTFFRQRPPAMPISSSNLGPGRARRNSPIDRGRLDHDQRSDNG
jgi:hypothetical protein